MIKTKEILAFVSRFCVGLATVAAIASVVAAASHLVAKYIMPAIPQWMILGDIQSIPFTPFKGLAFMTTMALFFIEPHRKTPSFRAGI